MSDSLKIGSGSTSFSSVTSGNISPKNAGSTIQQSKTSSSSASVSKVSVGALGDIDFIAQENIPEERREQVRKIVPLTTFEAELKAWVEAEPSDKRKIILKHDHIKFKKPSLRVRTSRSGSETIQKVADLCVKNKQVVGGLYQKFSEYNKVKRKEIIQKSTLEKIVILEYFKYPSEQLFEKLRDIDAHVYKEVIEEAVYNSDFTGIEKIISYLRELDRFDEIAEMIPFEAFKASPEGKKLELLKVFNNTSIISTFVHGAIKYYDLKLLKMMQENNIRDDACNLPLHTICSKTYTKVEEKLKEKNLKIVATLISMCREGTCNVEGNSRQLPFLMAVESANEDLVHLLIKKEFFSFIDASKKTPLFRLSERTKLSEAEKNIAKIIIENASIQELNGRYGSLKEAILVKLFENKHNDLAFAFIDRCLKENPTDEMLFTTWLPTILNQPLNEEAVQKIVKGLQAKSVENPTLSSLLGHYNRIQKACVSSADALRAAFFIQKHCDSKNQTAINYKSLKDDLHTVSLSDEAVSLLLEEAKKMFFQDLELFQIEAQLLLFKPYLGKTFTKRNALLTAIIFSVDVPKIQTLATDAFGRGGLLTAGTEGLPEGWKIFKNQSKITVISSQKLGEGAFKRAVTAIDAVYNNFKVNQAELSVFLEPKDKFVSKKDQDEFEYEMTMFEALGPSEYIVKAHAVRAPNDKKLIGRLDEVGVDFEHAFRGKTDPRPEEVLKRLDFFDDILHGIEFMHTKGFVHGDLKTPNCVVVKERGKITDLGTTAEVSKKVPYSFTKKSYGTPCYSSPDTKGTSNPSEEQMKAADVWALGMMLKDLYDGKQFGWSDHPNIDMLSEKQLADLVEKELTPIFEKLEQYKVKQPWTKEEQTKYHVYSLMKGLLGVEVAKDPQSQKIIVSVKPKLRLTVSKAIEQMGAIKQEIGKL